MVAGEAYKMISEVNFEAVPFLSGPNYFINFHLSQSKVALLGLTIQIKCGQSCFPIDRLDTSPSDVLSGSSLTEELKLL